MKHFVAVAVLLVFCAAAGSRADSIKLKSGDIITGKIFRKSAGTVQIEGPAGSQSISRDDIEWMREDAVHHGSRHGEAGHEAPGHKAPGHAAPGHGAGHGHR